MKEGPDIAQLGALIGDPARANMLTALMAGGALTASELAAEAGVTIQTASSHLKKLETADLLIQRKQGRHRYFALADDDVGALLETMMGLAARRGLTRTRTGPKDPALRKARVCYNHLAGELGVRLYDGLLASALLSETDGEPVLTPTGRERMIEFGIDIDALETQRRPLCRSCLDWSARRTHLAGSLGQSLLSRFEDLGWARREPASRVVHFTARGETDLLVTFCGQEPGSHTGSGA
ncbi:ArsR/SmtB family transcription factor [Hoeflea alexandrii]|uniref:ArsR/SmtB family transcription factor n=1 Tax=Hoeflea alexandrii TaxID=288436 RepID=UPI0022B01EC2|nr:winged helix-turn-helix domain-containing protein [Hoeflea alexandrii]MCZ4288229.1 winged helix-turn-helix domain-containing protein [Hoeflea alexandrii]